MNILLTVGSPRKKSNTYSLANKFKELAEERGHICDLVDLDYRFYPCSSCGFCGEYGSDGEYGRCIHDDELSFVIQRISTVYDCIIIASPIYFFHVSAQTKVFIDRLNSVDLKDKYIGAILVSGSGFFDGGSNLMTETLMRTCVYNDAEWIGVVQKTTNDQFFPQNPLTIVDIQNLNSLLDSMEGKETVSSCFIRS